MLRSPLLHSSLKRTKLPVFKFSTVLSLKPVKNRLRFKAYIQVPQSHSTIRQLNVDPTNNFAERCHRILVILRKPSFGTDAERGIRLIERMFSLIITANVTNSDLTAKISATIKALFLGENYTRTGSTKDLQPAGCTITILVSSVTLTLTTPSKGGTSFSNVAPSLGLPGNSPRGVGQN